MSLSETLGIDCDSVGQALARLTRESDSEIRLAALSSLLLVCELGDTAGLEAAADRYRPVLLLSDLSGLLDPNPQRADGDSPFQVD